jgi:regulatory protein
MPSATRTETATADCTLAEARAKVVALLARREYSMRELAQKLQARGVPVPLATEVIATLADEGLQSDSRFARSFVRERSLRGKGPVRIGQELRQRGIGAEMSAEALDAADYDWVELARSVLEKKFGRREAATPQARAKRQNFLAYRGFSAEQIRAALHAEVDA